MWGDLHENKSIEIVLDTSVSAGKANRIFRELGATLFYDVYAFELPKSEVETWQSESLLDIDLLYNDRKVDAQDDFNKIVINYPFSHRPSSDQNRALTLILQIICAFGGSAVYRSTPFTIQSVQEDWDKCNDYLLKEWGEQPGSEQLARMVEENYT